MHLVDFTIAHVTSDTISQYTSFDRSLNADGVYAS